MKSKLLVIVLCMVLVVMSFAGCSNENNNKNTDSNTVNENNESNNGNDKVDNKDNNETEEENNEVDFKGEELSILVSAGWMNTRYDAVIANFEEEYGVTVDVQALPGDQYFDILRSKLDTGTCADIFWLQSNPFAIESFLVEPEKYCIDFTGEDWENVIPDERMSSCTYEGALYGQQLWHNSPEYIMLYNKTLFEELGLEAPTTYDELKSVSKTIFDAGITPWFMPGADGWQHQLSFFQIGGIYEKNKPGLYEGLNNNTETFAGNEDMLRALEQFKEMSDLGYMGEDWIGTDSTNMINEIADRNCAFIIQNASMIKVIKEESGTTDEFGLALMPFNDNDMYPTNPAGPTMFGYKESEHPELVKAFFSYVCETENLQLILDNSDYTNIHVNDDGVTQHWLPEEEAFLESIPAENMAYPVLQTGTKYTNDFWMDFGADLVAYCQGQIEANEVLENMDLNRAESATIVGDPNWD